MEKRLRQSGCVLLLVDFINPLRFDGAEDIAPAALAAAKATAALKQRLCAAGVPAIYANDNYGVWHSDFKQLLGRCREQGGEAGELARLLAPADEDVVVLKPRHSAFHATPLPLLLEQMGARRLVLVGLAADICVQFTAMDAYVRGYELFVPADCTAAEHAADKDAALAWMARVLRANTEDSDHAAQRLLRPSRGGSTEGADAT